MWKFNNSLLRDMTFVNLVKQVILDLKKQYAVPVYHRNNIHKIDEEELVLSINNQLKKQYAVPVYHRNNIHKIDEEELVLSINDQLLFEMILLKIRGSCISYASFKKKEETGLEK